MTLRVRDLWKMSEKECLDAQRSLLYDWELEDFKRGEDVFTTEEALGPRGRLYCLLEERATSALEEELMSEDD